MLVRHGGAYYRVHPCQLMKVKEERILNRQTQTKRYKSETRDVVQPAVGDQPSVGYSDDDEDDMMVRVEDESEEDHHTEAVTGMDSSDANISSDAHMSSDAHRSSDACRESGSSGLINKPVANSFVKYKLNDVWNQAKILSRQPKQRGAFKNWVNVHNDAEDAPMSVNWDDVEEWSELPAPENTVLLTADQEMSQEVVDAKENELKNLIENEVFEEVPFENQTTVSTRWVISEKFKDGVKRTKARLVARGFEEDTRNLRIDSPTCSRECLRMVFMTAALMNWKLQSIDITAAFLQGSPLERDVYLRPPNDVCSRDRIWHLKRCIYGLNDAPRSWYNRVKELLCKLGGKVSAYDNALFLWHNERGALVGILVSHVDDFAFCGNLLFQEKVIQKLMDTFKVNTHESGSFKYLGLEVTQTGEGVQVHQDMYIPTIAPISIDQNRTAMKNDELSTEEKAELKRLSGQMMWVASHTRPDISFETCVMSNIGKKPLGKILHGANKALTKLKSRKVSLKIPCLGAPESLRIKAYSDATYGSLEDGSSQGGFIVFIQGKDNKVVPISWQSKKLDRVTKSPLASETLALSDAADAGFLISALIQEIFGLSKLPPIQCFTDNKSLTRTLETSNLISDRRLRVDMARLREMVSKEEIEVFWVEGGLQLADSLTKRGASTLKLLEVLSKAKL